MDEKMETGCCPKFNPESWDNKEITWKDKLFIKDSVKSFFHIPLNFGKVIVRNIEKIKFAGTDNSQNIMLSDEKSLWCSDLYIAVDKEVSDAQNEKISGNFLTKVFEGSYQNAGKWAKEMDCYVKSKGKEIKKMYFWYTACPKCAKIYGKNYTVILAMV
ncbi:MAG: hydrolase [Elusimicrobiota bacterium]